MRSLAPASSDSSNDRGPRLLRRTHLTRRRAAPCSVGEPIHEKLFVMTHRGEPVRLDLRLEAAPTSEPSGVSNAVIRGTPRGGAVRFRLTSPLDPSSYVP